MMRRLLVRIENSHSRLEQESPQGSFIASALIAHLEPGAQFSEDNKRQPDLIGMLDHFDDE